MPFTFRKKVGPVTVTKTTKGTTVKVKVGPVTYTKRKKK